MCLSWGSLKAEHEVWIARSLMGIRQEESRGRTEQRERSTGDGPDEAWLAGIALHWAGMFCLSPSASPQNRLPQEGHNFGAGASAAEADPKGADSGRLSADCCSHRPFEGRPGWVVGLDLRTHGQAHSYPESCSFLRDQTSGPFKMDGADVVSFLPRGRLVSSRNGASLGAQH